MRDVLVGDALAPHDPSTVGRWRIQSRLGAGGMGVVYLAQDGTRTAAIKVIRPGLLDDPQVSHRFAREVDVVRAVRDVHISEFLDADLTSEPAWLAVEYIEGPTLRDHVLARGPLSTDAWWAVVRGLSQALAVLQVHGVTHRDLKPANVILSPRGPVLIDFGIAHPEDATQLTATGMVTGSPSWLSPEQAELGQAGPSSDMFSLGSLLAFAATGRPPFGQGAAVAVLVAISAREPDLAGIDEERAALLRQLLAKKPSDRPTAAEVLALAKSRQRREPRLDLTQPAGLAPLGARPEPASSGTRVDRPLLPTPASAVPTSSAPVTSADPGGEQPTRFTRTLTALTKTRQGRVASLVATVFLSLFLVWGMSVGAQDDTADKDAGTEQSEQSGQPDPQGPAAPSKDQLRSGDWLLSSYAIEQEDGNYVVTGTVQNDGSAAASTDLAVYLYIGGEQVGVVSGSTGDVPAGGSAPVRLTGDSEWQPGQPTLAVEAS